ncbi:MAG: FG-GAP-like repeat-containing protein [Verrucomicrobiota bacterium]|jgi:hypothetical protein|nr:FG-GAP-like repeat-containing protein [Verrucomicrobiota bacterium]|tara:strand:- start:124 stop:1458 length:1335 start_codon:yes stop_codon:yes gene_type:complete
MHREDWEKGAFPYLEDLLGIDQIENYDAQTQAAVRARWDTIKAFYLRQSYEKSSTPSATEPPVSAAFGHRSTVEKLNVTAIHHDAANGLVYVGDELSRAVLVYDRAFRNVRTFAADKVPCDFELAGDRLYVCSHGTLAPLDSEAGEVGYITDSGLGDYRPLLRGLNRPTRYVPFRHSGVEYAVLCEYGISKGKVTVYRESEPVFVLPMSGAIDCRVLDADTDGQPEVYVLIAQEHECLLRLTVRPDGEVNPLVLIKKQPGWGFTAMEMLDADGDGTVNVLLSNGDTTEFRSNPRRYHGIRIYDLGEDELVEKQFIPAHGAMDFTMLDADADGDLDIASVSYFADFRHKPHQAAMLHLRSDGQFTSQPLPGHGQGRWCRIASGDIDGDGDPDLLLGSLNYQTTTRPYEKDASFLRSIAVPRARLARWEQLGNHLLVLENLPKRSR